MSDRETVTLVPAWFGMGPAELRSQIVWILRRAGGVSSGGPGEEDVFQLDLNAITYLRRTGVTARNQHTVTDVRELVRSNSELLARNRRTMTGIRAGLSLAGGGTVVHV